MNLGETIKFFREADLMAQKDFAERIGISQTSLSQIENNKTNPHPRTLKKISDELQVPIAFLYLLSLESKDLPERKRKVYDILKPTIETVIFQLID